MECIECKNKETTYDKTLGEIICDACGYVLVDNMPEETSASLPSSWQGNYMDVGRVSDRGTLGSIFTFSDMKNQKNQTLMRNLYRTAKFSRADESLNKGIVVCNMVLSYHHPTDTLNDRVAHNYKKIYRSGQMRGIDLDIRAVAIVFYSLRELGVSVLLRDIADRNQIPVKRASKVAKRIANILGKPWILHQINTDGWIEITCQKLNANNSFIGEAKKVATYMKMYMDRRDLTFTRVNLATAIYIVSIFRRQIGLSNYSQMEIAKVSGVVDTSIRLGMRNFLRMNGISKVELLQMPMDSFLGGIRYE
jgi:transcription initiation factor TFIIIB Brf1 subunit/transcription initiation factor TFIIB